MLAPIDVWHHSVFRSKAHAISADVVHAWNGNGNDEGRFGARRERRGRHGGAAAADEPSLLVEQENDGRQTAHFGARAGIADDAADRETIAIELVAKRDELERQHR